MFGRMQFIAKPSKKAIKRPHINFCNETEAKGGGEMVCVGTKTTGSGRGSLLARN